MAVYKASPNYSGWLLVTGYVCEVLQYGICRRYYVTTEWR